MIQSTHKTNSPDALSLLVHDHNEVKKAFKHFDALGDRAFVAKKKLADEICSTLTLHATLEEEIFYPAVRNRVKDSAAMIDEALVEHASVKDLIARIVAMSPEEDLFNATVKVLHEQIEHHLKEEEDELFVKVRKSNIDLVTLGQEMIERREQLFAFGSASWPYANNLVNIPLQQPGR